MKQKSLSIVFGIIVPAVADDGKVSLKELETLYSLFLVLGLNGNERRLVLESVLAGESFDETSLQRLNIPVPVRILALKALEEIRLADGRPNPTADRIRRSLEKHWKLTASLLKTIGRLNALEDGVIRLFNRDLPRERMTEQAERLASDALGAAASLGILAVSGKIGLTSAGILSGLAATGKLAGLPFIAPTVAGFLFLAATAMATSRVVRLGVIP